MKDNKVKEKFIQLRAEGLSYDRISQELDTSKPILLKWSKEFENEISEAKYIEFEAMLEKYKMLKAQRVRRYGEQLEKLREALKESELKDVPVTKLLDMALQLENKIKYEMRNVGHVSKETKQYHEEAMGVGESPKYTWHIE